MVNMLEGWHRASLAYSKVSTGHHWCYLLHIQLLRVWSGLRLCTILTMPSLVVYEGYRIGHDGRHGCYSLLKQSLSVGSGLHLCSISTMPSLVVYEGYHTDQGITGVIYYIYNH